MTEHAARRCADLAYSKRICGMSPTLDRPQYDGPFDFMMVVNSASLPADTSVEAHRRAWAAMRQLFTEEWRAQW